MPWSEKYHSAALDMQYSVHSDGDVMTEDKTLYSKRECKIIKEGLGEIDQQLHLVKSIFEGEVVDWPVRFRR